MLTKLQFHLLALLFVNRFIMNPHNDLLSADLIVQFVENYTGIVEVTRSGHVQD